RAAKLAYIDDAGTYTYGELAARVNRFANALGTLGIETERRVLLCLYDTIDFPVAFLGCITAGVIPVAVNTLVSVADLEYVLEDSRACAIVISGPLLGAFRPALEGARALKHRIVCETRDRGPFSMQGLLEASPDTYEPAPTTCDDMCFWLYSSGSTG